MKYVDSDDESDSSSSSSNDKTLGLLFDAMKALLSQRYLNRREPITKSSEDIQICLTNWKKTRPDLF